MTAQQISDSCIYTGKSEGGVSKLQMNDIVNCTSYSVDEVYVLSADATTSILPPCILYSTTGQNVFLQTGSSTCTSQIAVTDSQQSRACYTQLPSYK